MNKTMVRMLAIGVLSCLGLTVGRAGELSPFESFAGAKKVSGVVFSDNNGNGIREAGEAGLPGVRLLADKKTAVTGTDGAYVMESSVPFLTVSVSFPSGYWPASNRWFYRTSAETEEKIDFALKPEKQTLPFVFIHFTDPHSGLSSAVEAIPAETATWPVKPRFYLCGGDLRSQTVSVSETDKIRKDFGVMRDAFAKMNAPVFAVPGNHDVVDLKSGTVFSPEISGHPFFGQRVWEKWVGPASWSFSCGGVLFVGQEWAEYTGKGWESGTPAIKKWAAEERAAQPAGTRTVLLCHAGPVLDCELALSGHTHALGPSYGSERRLMSGHSGGHYTEAVWKSSNTRREEDPFVERVPVRTNPQLLRSYGEDGSPAGYRIVTVYPDRMDTFYKVLDEPRTIMVNTPRRNRPVTVSDGTLTVRGQVFDPEGKLTDVSVSCGGVKVAAELKRNLLWTDFTANLNTREWADGCQTLKVEAVWPDGSAELAENYVLLTGRQSGFKAASDAVIKGWVDRGKAATDVLVNGAVVGTVQPGSKDFSFPVSADRLKQLNLVSLGSGKDAAVLRNVHLLYGNETFVDQRLTSGFGLGRMLRADQPVYFDLTVPGKVSPWKITVK